MAAEPWLGPLKDELCGALTCNRGQQDARRFPNYELEAQAALQGIGALSCRRFCSRNLPGRRPDCPVPLDRRRPEQLFGCSGANHPTPTLLAG
jgi:hypothetical protein